MNEKEYSDEHLNAFVDGELGEAEKLELMDALGRDETLRRRIYALRSLKDMVKGAYESVPEVSRPADEIEPRPGRLRMAVAASVLLAVGIAIGWFAHITVDGGVRLAERGNGERHPDSLPASHAIESATGNVILHINRGDPMSLKAVLDTAESILLGAEAAAKETFVEIIANADGLALFRADTSPYSERIARMRERYGNLTFMVCGFAAERSGKREKRAIDFLPEAVMAPSAIERIVTRVKQGWQYVRI